MEVQSENPGTGQWQCRRRQKRPSHMLCLFILVFYSHLLITLTHAGCGDRTSSARIIGGSVADAQLYPWFVALVPSGRVTGSLDVLCGATLISPTHLLTAGHCFNGIPIGKQKDAFSPTFILENRCTAKYNSMSTVSKVDIHPQYNYQSLKNDIAVMTLQSPVSFTPACLPPTRPKMRGDGTVVGYGNTVTSGNKYPCQLQDATVRLYSRNECLRTANFIDIINLPNVFCAGRRTGGVDTCDGDSGGPLLRLNAEGKYYIQGITSFGHGCARPNNPGVYTDVSKYLNWIRRTTGMIKTTFAFIRLVKRRRKDRDRSSPVCPCWKVSGDLPPDRYLLT